MRAILLLAAIVGVSCLAERASAQGAFGTVPPTKAGANLPNYARPNLNTGETLNWTSRLMNMIPGFRNNTYPTGTRYDFPNPETNSAEYLKGFGYRRLR